jgi:hypothetical protein
MALFAKDTTPSRRPSEYDTHRILIQLGRIPEGKVKPLFSEAQWRVVTRVVDQYRQWELTVRQQGLILSEDDDSDRRNAPPAALKK